MEIDIFSRGGAERTAEQFGVAFLGSVELDPEMRQGGDAGLPMALAGPDAEKAKPFYKAAAALVEKAMAQTAKGAGVLEIT